MNKPTEIAYLSWVKAQPLVRFNLVRSGIIPVTHAELDPPPEALEFYGLNSYGYEPLLQRIADRYRIAPEQVVTVSGGTSLANYLVCTELIRPGDDVLLEDPVYEPLLALPAYLGAVVRRFPRRFTERYNVDGDSLAASIQSNTRLIILTNLHNPTGVRLSLPALQTVGAMADRVGARVLVDEAYLDLLYETPPNSAIALGGPFVVTSSLTKAYGLDGLRAGWVLCDASMASRLRRLQDFMGGVGVNIAERLAALAFDRMHDLIARSRRIVAPNRARVEAFMKDHPRLTWVPPDAGMIAFPRLRRPEAQGLYEHLLKHYDTLICPGHFFEAGDHHFRLSFGMPGDVLEKGLENLGRALKDLNL